MGEAGCQSIYANYLRELFQPLAMRLEHFVDHRLYLFEREDGAGERVEGDRGCASCEVRETCARCLFTGPIGEEEYCRANRAATVKAGMEIWDSLLALKDLL